MPAPRTIDQFLDVVKKSGLLDETRLETRTGQLLRSPSPPNDPLSLAGILVREGLMTRWQADQFLQGKSRGFQIGKYNILDRLGSGGMSCVYLCKDRTLPLRVAVKVLPKSMADDETMLKRFYREARATATLDHPHVIHAYAIDQTDQFHYMVMEYVDGKSLEEIVQKDGPLSVGKAVKYIRQTALGLQYIHESGLIHRDIKPGNLLLEYAKDSIKILDMGLARFFNDNEELLTRGVLGTVDYFAPEQTMDSHAVDSRADIYSLGGTMAFLLTGSPPFEGGTVIQKIQGHRRLDPRPIRAIRPDVPEAVVTIILKMMAKDPAQRYQNLGEVWQALAPWAPAR
jgi:serine/threonine protein kinase